MGLFSFIKEIREYKKKRNAYLSMSIEELKELSDDDLFEALSERINEEEKIEVSECLVHFKGAKRIFYIINYFDMEVQNGGLCHFFVNSSREIAPYLLECLHTIEANKYEKLLEDFITKHQISLNHLESFIIDDIDDYEKQTERYPFDDFDDAYYELYENHPLNEILLKYAKNHLNDF